MKNYLKGRSLLKLLDYSKQDIQLLIDLAQKLKKDKREGSERKYLSGKNIALIFEKDSTRTRCSFEVAGYDQGANVTYLGPTGSQMGNKETIKDTARVLGRYYVGIEYRGFKQETVEMLSEFSGVPVWNGLTDEFHPTQGLADLLTMIEHSSKPIEEISYCYIGDARFNMGNTLLLIGAIMGMDVKICAPRSLQPSDEIITKAHEIAKASKSKVLITENPEDAVNSVDFIHTDVWVSMGEPESVWEERIELLKDYQVNSTLFEMTQNPGAKFMHCLPAFHNSETTVGKDIKETFGIDSMEVTEGIFESDRSIVFDQAENRLHTIKSVMVASLTEELPIIINHSNIGN